MFFVVRLYRGRDPLPLCTSRPLEQAAVDAALGDLALSFRTLGGDVHQMDPPRRDEVIGHVSLDISLGRVRLSAVVDPAGTAAKGTVALEEHQAAILAEREGRWSW